MAHLSLSSLSPPPSSSSSPPLRLHGRIFSPFCRVQVSSSSTSYLQPKVVVTREHGKNGKLINVLVRLFSFLFFLLSNFWLLEVFDFSIPKLGLAMCLFVSVCLFLSPYICIYTQLGYLHFFFPDSISFGFVGGWGELMIK